MHTRTRVYLVTYMIVIIMLMILYEVILKTLKNHAFAHVNAYYPAGTLNIFCLLDCVFWPRKLKMASRCPQDGPRWPKMAQDGPEVAQDGPKLAPRWPQDGSHGGLGGAFRSMTSYKNEHLMTNACQYNADIGFKPL